MRKGAYLMRKVNLDISMSLDGFIAAVQQAKKAAIGKNVSVGTANIAQHGMKAKLLDELHLYVAPVLLGRAFVYLIRLEQSK